MATNDDVTCAICQDSSDYEQHDVIVVIAPCGHKFAKPCVERYMEVRMRDRNASLTCPMCRRVFTSCDVIPVTENSNFELRSATQTSLFSRWRLDSCGLNATPFASNTQKLLASRRSDDVVVVSSNTAKRFHVTSSGFGRSYAPPVKTVFTAGFGGAPVLCGGGKNAEVAHVIASKCAKEGLMMFMSGASSFIERLRYGQSSRYTCVTSERDVIVMYDANSEQVRVLRVTSDAQIKCSSKFSVRCYAEAGLVLIEGRVYVFSADQNSVVVASLCGEVQDKLELPVSCDAQGGSNLKLVKLGQQVALLQQSPPALFVFDHDVRAFLPVRIDDLDNVAMTSRLEDLVETKDYVLLMFRKSNGDVTCKQYIARRS